MARLVVGDFIDMSTGASHDATSWVVAKDPEFNLIIDQSIRDTVNIKEWHTMLPKRSEDGEGYYKAEEELWVKIQIHMGATDSNWLVIGPKSQTYQEIAISEDDKEDILTNTDELDMYFTK